MLTIDVGNSSVGLGRWTGDHVALTRFAEPELAGAAVAGEQAVAVSVAPPRLERLLHAVAQARTGSVRVLEGVPLPLADPRLAQSAGADRLAAALALLPGPAVAVDAGTAVTVDLVGPDGVYLGGFIGPGPAAGLAGLLRAAPSLPDVVVRAVPIVPGLETLGAMGAGLWGLAVGGVDRLVDAALARLGETSVRIVATGGWGPAWAAASRHAHCIEVDEVLVHRGMRRWARASSG